LYRGRDALRLSEACTLEEIASLLWNMKRPLQLTPKVGAGGKPSLANAFNALALRAPNDLPSLGRSPVALQAEAESVLSTMAEALAPGNEHVSLHERLAASFGRPQAADLIRRALVLLADHELNASTFTARVTASAGATLSACVLSGLSTLTGPLHGGAWRGVQALIDNADASGARSAVQFYLAQGQALSGFGHLLYPDGDIRARAMLPHIPLPPVLQDIEAAVKDMVGEQPNIDFAMSALAATFDLPADAPLTIFALARTVGWLAHAMEQANTGQLIRPRARYIGQPLEIAAE
jgi:citrate synthase